MNGLFIYIYLFAWHQPPNITFSTANCTVYIVNWSQIEDHTYTCICQEIK